MYQAVGSHPAIISKEAFDDVQAERECRSNVIKGSDGAIRKSTRYSSLKSIKAHEQGEGEEQPNQEESGKYIDRLNYREQSPFSP
jgi:hypothetical protein